MKQGKRWMAYLLALVLCVSVFAPVTAFADGEERALMLSFDYATEKGKGHVEGFNSPLGQQMLEVWKQLPITVTDGVKTVKVDTFFADKDGNENPGSQSRFGGKWKDGTELTVTVDTSKLPDNYHMSYTGTKDDNERGWVLEGGYSTVKIKHGAPDERENRKGKPHDDFRVPIGWMEVEFDLKGGNIGGQTEKITKTVKKDNTVDFPQDPVKEGLHFASWYTETKKGQRFTWDATDQFSEYNRDWQLFNDPAFDALYDGVFRLRALWEAEVTFQTDGGTAIAPVRVEEGKTLTAPANPTKSGYIFQGWTTQDGNDFDFNTAVKKDMTLVAKWKRRPSGGGTTGTTETIIKIDPNGGTWNDGTTKAKEYTVNVGDEITLPEAPTREGYKFIGWGDGYKPGDKYTVKDGGHTFVAEWEKDEKKPEDKPGTDSTIKTPRGSALTHDEIAKILAGMKNTVPAIPKAGVGR